MHTEDWDSCLTLTPGEVSLAQIRRQIEKINRIDGEQSASFTPNQAFRKLIDRNLSFLSESQSRKLKDISFYVVDLPLYQAIAIAPATVVIGNGLLNVLTACGYWANFCAELPPELESIIPLDEFPTTSLSSAVSVFSFFLIHRHVENSKEEPLPDFRGLFEAGTFGEVGDIDEKVKHAIAGAGTFVLLHEIGHLRLGHFSESDEPKISSFSSPVEQAFNEHQLRELEADAYAMNALKEPLRALHTPWISMALNFHLQREIMVSERAGSHPLHVNRLAYADRLIQDDYIKPADFIGSLRRMGKSFSNVEEAKVKLKAKNQQPLVYQFDRTDILLRLASLNDQLTKFGIDLSAILDHSRKLPDWRSCYFAEDMSNASNSDD